MNIFQKFKAALRIDAAIEKAENEYRKTGNRYYVMPYSDSNGKLIIMDRYNFRKLKQKGYINRNAFVRDLERECFYYTPYNNGSSAITPEIAKAKREEYFKWYSDSVKRYKQKKRNELHGKK